MTLVNGIKAQRIDLSDAHGKVAKGTLSWTKLQDFSSLT